MNLNNMKNLKEQKELQTFENWDSFIKHLKGRDECSVYLSGSISAIGSAEASKKFERFRHLFVDEDICASSTFSQLHPSRRKKIYYIRHGIKTMIDKDAVIILGDNTNSKGSKIEENLATDLGMSVYQITFPNIDEIEVNKLTIKQIN